MQPSGFYIYLCEAMYRIEQNFGGEKTLANLANRHNSPSFFANIPDEARGHAVCVVNV